MISQKYLPSVLNKYLFSSGDLHETVLTELLEGVKKHRDQRYTLLQRQERIPYLLFEKEYYSTYYYDKVHESANKPKDSINPCEEVYQEKLLTNHSYIVTR